MENQQKEFEIKIKNIGWGHNAKRKYCVVNKSTGAYVGNSHMNYIFPCDDEGLNKARSISSALNDGKKVKV